MSQILKVDDSEYDINTLSDDIKAKLALIQFAKKREEELVNMQALLQRAKNSYIESLKKEMLSNKAGFLFGDD